MAAMSRGQISKPAAKSKSRQMRAPKRTKGGTESTRNHVFKGFSQRIAQLKIEPIRRGRSTIIDDAELESNFSYFRDSFVEWRELNLSENFTMFARKVAPLCDSLPQVLHHRDRIFNLLIEFIEKGEKFSEEPLLSLMAHLAHDLGERFEDYFAPAVRTVSKIASTHADVEVIEWSFGCLAWLFKYLSRLLVPDLRPVFDLLSPLLGKEHQKAFVSRFAAESLSFLVRKAGAAYHRDKAPLRSIIKYVSAQLKDLQESDMDYQFQQGLMYLFTDSLKGLNRGFHSSAVAILQELVAEMFDGEHAEQRSPPLEAVVIGVVTASIHHSDSENFQPLLDTLIAQISSVAGDARHVGVASRLLLVICGVRSGSRVAEWSSILETTAQLVNSVQESDVVDEINAWELLPTIATIYQYCALDTAIRHERLFERLTKDQWERFFLPFCNLFADFGVERFKTLVLPYFKRFITQKVHVYGQQFCVTLPHLFEIGALTNRVLQPTEKWYSSLPQSFEELSRLTQDTSVARVYYCDAILDAVDIINSSRDQTEVLHDSVKHIIAENIALKTDKDAGALEIFATGGALQFLIKRQVDEQYVSTLWPTLCQLSPLYGDSLAFWRSLHLLLVQQKGDLDLTGDYVDSFKQIFMRCFKSPSHDMRLIALDILEIIAGKTDELRNIISVAKTIEQTPLDLSNQRAIAMRVGQLTKLYSPLATDYWIGEVIPTFFFGLLHMRLASIWDEACFGLKAISKTSEGEVFVTQLAFDAISTAPLSDQPNRNNPVGTSTHKPYVTEFECTNVLRLQGRIHTIPAMDHNIDDEMEAMFNRKHAIVPCHNTFSRTQALRVLNSLPHLAEKRSRVIVPVLLDWTVDQSLPESADIGQDTEELQDSHSHRWARKDQKAMLTLFSKFTNPKVLFRSEEVHAALLVLLSNGDIEIQKAALQAILAWKDPALTSCQDELLHLLDDARFRDELPIFLSDDKLQNENVEKILPVVLRLLYGKVVAGKRGLESKRKAVFVGLRNRFGAGAIHQFLKIALGPLSTITLIQDDDVDETLLQQDLMDVRKRFGVINMLDDLLSSMEATFTPFTSAVVDPILYCAITASRSLVSASKEEEGQDSRSSNLSMLKVIRQRSLMILSKLFEICPDHPWQPYMAVIVNELIVPRLAKFPIETAQSISGLLRLFAAWSKSSLTVAFLVRYDRDILTQVVKCLNITSAKDEVKRFVLDDILRSIITLVTPVKSMDLSSLNSNHVYVEVVQPYTSLILTYVGTLLKQSPSKEVLESAVHTVADIAPLVSGGAESREMIELATFLLRQPSKRVNPRTKLGLLKILHEFIRRCDTSSIAELFDQIYEAVCPMFAFVHDRVARDLLCSIIQDLSSNKHELDQVATLCYDLNSYATGRLDEPDFDRRSKAYAAINSEEFRSYSVLQWKPLIYNMLFFIKDNDELSIRVNASMTLRRFIDASTTSAARDFALSAVLPGIQSGMREASELVRTEFLNVLEHMVKTQHEWVPISDLRLLLSEDEEASFFSNILHIQSHRRLRALRRLATVSASQLQPGNVYHILIPLLEQFVYNKGEDDGADSLLGETIKTLTSLCEGLEWPQFRSLLKRYLGYLISKEEMQKPVIKLIAGLLDGLNQAGRAKGYLISDNHTVDSMVIDDADKPPSTLSKTLPQHEKLTKDLSAHVLPELSEFLHKKDEATVSLRVPIAVAMTKVLLVLPQLEVETRLPAILLDICHILKSRAQESRDMSRTTLADIAALLGTGYLGFILKALRSALQRGYQLHVLSFTVHHILVKLNDTIQPGDLDYCLADIVDVIMDDTFGITGQEKDAEEYISKMKEVKSSKSFDSMDIVARSATPAHIIKLVLPIKSLLVERLNARMVQKIDELLRRIGLGVLQNPTVNSRDILVFCYELIQEAYAASSATDAKPKHDPKNRRYLVNNKGAAKSGARLSTSSYLHKMIRFGLDILRTVLRKHTDLQTPQNLVGFLPIIGDAMVQGQEEVQVSAVRLLTTIIKVSMPELDANCPVYIDEAMRAIKGSVSSNSELAQASLKLMSAVLRDRPNVRVSEKDVGNLLKRMLPDLDEPDRSGATFGFLKAVMSRHFDVPEIYVAMDKVAEMMVTNQTKAARDTARSHYFQFLTSYTQSEKRFKKQMEFLLKNLRYEHVEGRQSVMEALDLVLSKALPRFPEKAQEEYHGMIFLPLVNTLANDDATKCREMASLLVKRLFQHASDSRLHKFVAELKSWLEQEENLGMKRLGIQCWGFYFEALDDGDEPRELSYVLDKLDSTIDMCLARRDEDDWELLYYSLNLLARICKKYADTMFEPGRQSLWSAIQASAIFPHTWVKLKAAELLGMYFAHLGIANKENGLSSLPLEGSAGLQLAEQSMIQMANIFLKNLLYSEATESLCMQSVKNIAFLARCFAVNEAKWQQHKVDDEDEEDEEAAQDDTIETNGTAISEDEQSSNGEPAAMLTQSKQELPTAFHRLMVRLSGVVRRDTSSLNAKIATMNLFETITAKFQLEPMISSLPSILATLNTLVDPATTIPRSYTQPTGLNEPNDIYKSLIDKAREIMSTIQKRMGTQDYLKIMSEVQKAVREKRDERRRKRKVDAVIDPERYGTEKKRRNEIKKVKRKERGQEQRSLRRGW